MTPSPPRIGSRVLDGRRALLIAEMAWAHDGSLDHALTMIDAAADGGFDVFNIHLTSMPDYMVGDYGAAAGEGRVSAGHETSEIYRYLEELDLSGQERAAIAAHVHARGLSLSAMCNDIASVAVAVGLDADVLTVAPACLPETEYLRAVGATGLPVMLGVGGARLGEIEAALETLADAGASGCVLQYGVQAYPTDPAALDLRWLTTLRDTFGLPVAYHDHTDAESPLAFDVPLVVLGLGVAALEKHVTHDRAAKGEDHESALQGAELADFARRVRVVEAALGDPHWRPLSDTERRYREVVRKRAVARGPIAAGARLSAADVIFKRADAGVHPAQLPALLGRVTARELAADEPITAEALGA